MQNMRNSILRHAGMRCSTGSHILNEDKNVLKGLIRKMCTSKSTTPDPVMDRVIGLVKKFDKTDGAKVTKTADFQKDLSMDSLDRVELVMAFEEEFSIEIPEENADKLTCCADVAKYITAEIESKAVEKSS